jgi:RND family efflux transporter MFP subunit
MKMARLLQRRNRIAALVLLAASGAAAIQWHDQVEAAVTALSAEPAKPFLRPDQPVRVTTVALRPLAGEDSYTGIVRPATETTLGFRVAGKLVERLVDVGDAVTAGQVIARLDDTDARLEHEAAEAEVAAAGTDLTRATAALRRNEALFAEGHIAQAALDAARSGAAEAEARLDRAVRSADLAANRLGYTELKSDDAGVVTEVAAEAGQVVAAGQAVVSIAEGKDRDVVFALPEHRRAALDGAAATATIWGDEGPALALSLRDVSPDVDPLGRTYRVRMTLADPDGRAALGRTVTVKLKQGTDAPVASLPLAAVLNDGQGAAVWRLAGEDAVERVPVEIAALDGRLALVRGGLTEGDTVVSLGAHKIDPDRPVRVVETTATPVP